MFILGLKSKPDFVHNPVFSVRDPPRQQSASNPSKRHRERLNGELETVACLLPYDPATVSRLDKLSVLRLAVAYLQVKAHFSACLHSAAYLSQLPLLFTHAYPFVPTPQHFSADVPTLFDATSGIPLIDAEERFFESIAMKALGGFVLVLNNEGDVFYVSENVENFLGFHQSDILHQPLYELIHSEDREDIRQQLEPSLNAPPGCSSVQDLLSSDNLHCLERNVNARFRCLLDNTCGFLRMDVRGKLLSLHGLPQSFIMSRPQSAILGLIAICTPFVPPSNVDTPSEDLILKSKHQLDNTLISMDFKMHEILELEESDLPASFYSLIHPEDAICMAEAHKEVVKNGSSGLLIYRLISNKSRRVYYVQSSCRMFYKNGKSDLIGLTHRLLNEVEGLMLLEKRSSLKAKLLSFDDSLLQSPRNLQSAAALPSICATQLSLKPSDAEDEGSAAETSSSPSTSRSPQPAVPAPPAPPPSRKRRAKSAAAPPNDQANQIENRDPAALEHHGPLWFQQFQHQPWPDPNIVMPPELLQWSEWPPSAEFCQNIYTANFGMPYPQLFPSIPEMLPSIECQWPQQAAPAHPMIGSLSHHPEVSPIKRPIVPYPIGEKQLPAAAVPQYPTGSQFALISEATNALLGPMPI